MEIRHLEQDADTFRSLLIDWYDEHARSLPWRNEPSLYKTVVSEFMLQQTQVKTVLPYFAQWLEDYPDFAALARADESAVLKSWEGLGYYSRARNLHRLAQQVAKRDTLPTDAKSWLQFPGVGPYAAAAICSISFSDPTPVIDGNVVRILARLTADETAFKNPAEALKRYGPLATILLNHERPGDHNQAMMELGATVCHRQNPQCLLCPVSSLCKGREKGIEQSLPRLAKTTYEKQTIHRAWIERGGKVLVRQIPQASGRMKGLHEIPELKTLDLETPKASPLLTRKRSITRYRITEHFHSIDPKKLPETLGSEFRWATQSELEKLPFSGPHRRWIREILP